MPMILKGPFMKGGAGKGKPSKGKGKGKLGKGKEVIVGQFRQVDQILQVELETGLWDPQQDRNLLTAELEGVGETNYLHLLLHLKDTELEKALLRGSWTKQLGQIF